MRERKIKKLREWRDREILRYIETIALDHVLHSELSFSDRNNFLQGYHIFAKISIFSSDRGRFSKRKINCFRERICFEWRENFPETERQFRQLETYNFRLREFDF